MCEYGCLPQWDGTIVTQGCLYYGGFCTAVTMRSGIGNGIARSGQRANPVVVCHAEHLVVEGTALVTCADEQVLVREGGSVYLPPGSRHGFENPDRIPVTLIGVQVGPYLVENDIVRIEDIYSRTVQDIRKNWGKENAEHFFCSPGSGPRDCCFGTIEGLSGRKSLHQ